MLFSLRRGTLVGCLCLHWSAKCSGEPSAKPLTLVRQLPSEERHWTKIGVECCWKEYIGFSSLENIVSSWKIQNTFAECRKMSDMFSFISTFLPKYLAKLLLFSLKTGTCCDDCYAVDTVIFWGKEGSKETFYPAPVFKLNSVFRLCPSVKALCEATVQK